MSEQIIETKNCKSCWQQFHITNKDKEFYDKVSPIFNWNKYQIPNPTLCPTCRQQRRFSWRNERKLYRTKCDKTGTPIISIYSEDKPYVVLSLQERWSDHRDPTTYWQEYSTEKSFFAQFKELFLKVPKTPLVTEYQDQTNCDYTNSAWPGKNCYLAFEMAHCEDVMYSESIFNSDSCLECSFSDNLHNCYYCVNSDNCSKVFYGLDSHNCSYCSYIYDCTWCQNCFMSANLNNKQYNILNKQYTKEEYEIKIKEYQQKIDEYTKKHEEFKHFSPQQVFWKFKELISTNKTVIHKYYSWLNNKDCTWNYITNCKNSTVVFDSDNIEDCKYCSMLNTSQDCYDFDSRGEDAKLVYEVEESWRHINNIAFSILVWNNCNNLYYCHTCVSCSNCFGCDWLKNKEFCILNKQYNKDEYFEKVQKIIWQMMNDKERWELFPTSMSPFAYNESTLQDFFPLTKQEVLDKWRQRKDEEDKEFSWKPYSPKNISIYQNNKDKKKELLDWIIKCRISWRPFKITKQELEFYIKQWLPIPNKHPNIRHQERMQLRNSRKLHTKNCDKCKTEIQTTYIQNKQKIYCEKCYQQEVYG